MTLLLALSLLSTAHAQQVETIGGEFAANNDDNAVKLATIKIADAVVITQSEFQVSGDNGAGDIILVLYKRDGASNTWNLVDSVPTPTRPTTNGNPTFASSGPVEWVLLPDETYGIGAWIGDGWDYYYTQFRPEVPSFGRLTGSARTSVDAPPPTFEAGLENFFYRERLTFVSADEDKDGLVAQQWGGDDCDDTNPDVGAVAEEIPYDGIDQDCNGSDLTDVDDDGAKAEVAGGKDCDDTNAGIGPKAAEICGDGIDQDCVDGDLPCTESTDTDVGGGAGGGLVDGPEKIVAAGCACDTNGSAGGALVAFAALALARRRRV